MSRDSLGTSTFGNGYGSGSLQGVLYIIYSLILSDIRQLINVIRNRRCLRGIMKYILLSVVSNLQELRVHGAL